MAPENLFPSIGTLAEQTDSSDPDKINDAADAPAQGDDDRVVQEIESLCMNCEEQVSTDLSSVLIVGVQGNKAELRDLRGSS
jgi:hypothetical protein